MSSSTRARRKDKDSKKKLSLKGRIDKRRKKRELSDKPKRLS